MIVVVDIGNSNIVIGIMDQDRKIQFSGRIPTDKRGTKETYLTDIGKMLEENPIPLCYMEGTVISSVVPEITEIVRDCMESLTDKKVLVVKNDIKTDMEIVTDAPSKVGTDLIVDAVAADTEYGGKIVIFDLGTATTCSVVDNGKYLGTIIIPGVAISQAALAGRASQLPQVDLQKPEKLIGTNTIESMLSGMIYGTAAMIDGLIDRVMWELEDKTNEGDRDFNSEVTDIHRVKVTVLATGGIANLIVPYCRHEIIYEPDLLLKGLWYIYYKNVK